MASPTFTRCLKWSTLTQNPYIDIFATWSPVLNGFSSFLFKGEKVWMHPLSRTFRNSFTSSEKSHNSSFKHFNYQKTTQITIISKHIKNVSKHIKTYQNISKHIQTPSFSKFPCSASPFAEPEKNLRPWKFQWLCCSLHPWHAHWSEGRHPVRAPVPRYSCCFPPPQLGKNAKKPGRKKRKISAN